MDELKRTVNVYWDGKGDIGAQNKTKVRDARMKKQSESPCIQTASPKTEFRDFKGPHRRVERQSLQSVMQ